MIMDHNLHFCHSLNLQDITDSTGQCSLVPAHTSILKMVGSSPDPGPPLVTPRGLMVLIVPLKFYLFIFKTIF